MKRRDESGIIQTKWVVQVSLWCKYRQSLSLRIQTDEQCAHELYSSFCSLYQWGRATAGGERHGNLERISHSLIFCLHFWGFETKAPVDFLTVTFFKSAQPQRCDDTLSCCFIVTRVNVLPPCECFWLLVKVCGTCRISCVCPLPNICASRINSVQPEAL